MHADPAATDLATQLQAWDGLGVVVRFDRPTGTWIFICLHDDTLGPCTGGTRMAVYPEPAAALRDGMRLAEGMTCKWAAVGGSFGGGKSVLAVPGPLSDDARRGLLHRYGALVESLGGRFLTGEDLGTSSADMVRIAERTRYVHGFDPRDGAKVDPSPFTARAVLSGLRAALAEVYGSDDPRGRTVLVQGVGNVGRRLAQELAAAGARLLLSDIDEARAASLGGELGAEVVAAERVYPTPCDVYAPCAVGATLSRETVSRLDCRIVAGSANNQLAEPADAERLHERGILYVPDYIVNAGGALSFALLGQGIADRQELLRRVEAIGGTVAEVLREAAGRKESPVAAAQRRVDRALARAREAAAPPPSPAGAGAA